MAPVIPYLTFPLHGEEEEFSNGCRLYSLKENKFHKVDHLSHNYGKSHCVGSSHGYLVMVDQSANPYLLQPFSATQILLPSIDTFSSVKRVHDFDDDKHGFIVDNNKLSSRFFGTHSFMTLEAVQKSFLYKVILSSDPLEEKDDGDQKWVAIAIDGESSKLYYCNSEINTWIKMENSYRSYCDVICSKDTIFALSSDKVSVESWKLKNSVPVKAMNIDLSFPTKSSETLSSPKDLYSTKNYIVESEGSIMLVVRFVGEFVNGEGKAVREEDLLTKESTHPLVCPYRTLFFHVYKLDMVRNEWVEVENLGDRSTEYSRTGYTSIEYLVPDIEALSIQALGIQALGIRAPVIQI